MMACLFMNLSIGILSLVMFSTVAGSASGVNGWFAPSMMVM